MSRQRSSGVLLPVGSCHLPTIREPSPRDEGQRKVRVVLVKPAQSPDGSQSVALCWSEGRTEKDRAIRQKQEVRFLADTEKLAKRIELGRLKSAAKIYEAIGRLKERYPRVALATTSLPMTRGSAN